MLSPGRLPALEIDPSNISSAKVPTPDSGALSDSAIAGVAYSTSSGVTGVTDASGKYKYNVGDTVTFTLGTLTLGTVTATGIISPVQLAAGNATS